MRLRILLLFASITGCSPVIDAQLQLIDTSRHGIALVKQSVDDRQSLVTSLQTATRSRLDAAFDADVKAQPQPISPDWILEARKAYATAIDALAQQQSRSMQAAQTDDANLDAIDQALQQLDSINRAESQLIPNLNLFTKGPTK